MDQETISDRLNRAIGERYEQNDEFLSNAAGATLEDIQRFRDKYERNLYGRSGLSLERLEVDIPKETGDDIDKVVRLSLVSSSIDGTRKGQTRHSVTPGRDINLTPVDDGRWKLMRPTAAYREPKWRARRIEEINKALEFRPHVICLPEFAFPPPTDRNDHTGYPERANYGRLFTTFENNVAEAIDNFNEEEGCASHPFMFLGSYHCPDDHFNIGVIYPEGSNRAAFNTVVTRTDAVLSEPDPEEPPPPPQTIKLKPPLLYRKRYPASRAGEVARTPSRIQFNTYNYKQTRIAVLICSDVLDLNQFMNMVRINEARASRFPIDLVLVPAYNMSPILKSICRELSFAAATAVAYVNANPQWDKGFPTSELFVCGHDAEELKHLSGELSPVVVKDEFEKLPEGGLLRNIELSVKPMNALKYQIRRLHAQTSSSPRLEEWVVSDEEEEEGVEGAEGEDRGEDEDDLNA